MVPSTDINPGTDCVSEPSAVSERSSLDPVLSQTMATRASPVQNTLANSQDLQLSSQPGAQHEKAGLARVKGASSCCSCDFHSLLNPGREWDTSVSNHCSLCQQEREREELNQLYFMGLSKTDQDRYLSTYCCEEDSLWFGLTEIPDWEDDEERELVISRSALPKGSLLFEQVLGEVAPEVRALEDSSVTITCLRPQSLRSSIEKETDASHDDRKGLKKRISWADQKGLPLKSEVFFED